MNITVLSSKVLRGELSQATLSMARLHDEARQKYARDEVGFKWVLKHHTFVNKLHDDLEGPIHRTAAVEGAMSLLGFANFNSETVWKKLEILLPLYFGLLEGEGKSVEKRAEILVALFEKFLPEESRPVELRRVYAVRVETRNA